MRVVVIGAGFGGRVVAPVYRDLGCEVTLVSPRDEAAVAEALATGADLVSVHSPPFLHRGHVLAALAAGSAVLCDKPFGLDGAEARAMLDAACAAGLPAFLNLELRRQPARAEIKRLLEAGAIGTLRHMHFAFFGSGLRRRPHGWLFDAARGGGWLGAFGSHAIDALRWLTGAEVAACGGVSRIETRVRADAAGASCEATAEDAFTAWFAMSDGVTVGFDTAFSGALALPQRWTLLGDAGAIEMIGEDRVILRRPGAAEVVAAFPIPAGDPHLPALVPWLADVVGAVREGRTISPSFEDGVAMAEAMDLLRANMIRAGAAR